MSSNFYFKNIRIKNFRAFDEIVINGFKRINIISGLNATGKSTLLETLFLSVDLSNPSCLIRPYQARGLLLSGNDLEYLIRDKSIEASIHVKFSHGDHDIQVNFGKPDIGTVTVASSANNIGVVRHLNTPDLVGINLISKVTGRSQSSRRMFVNQTGAEISSTSMHEGMAENVVATFLDQAVKSAPQEVADRVSKVIRSHRRSELIGYIKRLFPAIDDISILQDGEVSQVYAVVRDNFIPIRLMGSGVHASFELISAIMISKDGVILMDEIDSLLHFSVVPKLWSLVGELSRSQNVQIFAVTHSKEAIFLATQGLRNAEVSSDFQFLRLEEVPGAHSATSYDLDDVRSAFELNVEIRK